LGSGALTRNPYASYWLIPLSIATASTWEAGLLYGAIIGASHGVTRGLGIIANKRRSHPVLILTQQVYWRKFDGLVLLVATGLIAGQLFR
jgi:hypothetical protein